MALKGSLQRLGEREPSALAAKRFRRWVENLTAREAFPSAGWEASGMANSHTVPLGRVGLGRLRVTAGMLVSAFAMLAAVGLVLVRQQHDPVDQAGAVEGIVEIARLERPPFSGARHGEVVESRSLLELEDQKVRLERHLVDGHEILVATSESAFAMPADALRLGTGPGVPWLAMRGDLGIACLSQPTHMLVVGALPARQLVEIGHQLQPL